MSSIEWTDETWNPVTGCTKVSQGCKHCYAERDWKRLSANPATRYHGREFTDVQCHQELLQLPLHWRKPRRIFINSMSDLFHEDVPDDFIANVFGVMAAASWHTFQILTKRPQRMLGILNDHIFEEAVEECTLLNTETDLVYPLPNVWLGVSCEDQSAADERIPLLLRTPAAVHWVSAEPLLGPIDLQRWLPIRRSTGLAQWVPDGNRCDLHWVVVGGESGPKARPMHPDWARSLRNQCQSAGVPFFFKQWGEWAPQAALSGVVYGGPALNPDRVHWLWPDGKHEPVGNGNIRQGDGHELTSRVGKRAAGRTLDGRTWDEYPA